MDTTKNYYTITFLLALIKLAGSITEKTIKKTSQ
jgi:hypothetical protein